MVEKGKGNKISDIRGYWKTVQNSCAAWPLKLFEGNRQSLLSSLQDIHFCQQLMRVYAATIHIAP